VLIPGIFGAAFGFRSIGKLRREIVRNSGDTTWITDAVIRQYTAGQTVDLSAEVPQDQRELLRERLEDFVADTVSRSGQYSHEEQPVAVVAGSAAASGRGSSRASLRGGRVPDGSGSRYRRWPLRMGMHQPLASSRAGAMSRVRAHRPPLRFHPRRESGGGLSSLPTSMGPLRRLTWRSLAQRVDAAPRNQQPPRWPTWVGDWAEASAAQGRRRSRGLEV
jgi:hypothetical protein